MRTGINSGENLKQVRERLERLLQFHLGKGDTAIVLKIDELELLFEHMDTQAKQIAEGRALLKSANELLKLAEKSPDLELEIELQDAWLKEVADE